MYHITHVKLLLLWNGLRPASTGLGPESLRLFVRVAQSQLPTSSRTLPVSVWTPVHQPQSVALSSTTKLFHELTSWLRNRNGSPHFTFSLHPSFCNAAFRWDWRSFEKTNVRSIHPQCRYYSWILRHRRLGRFEKTLTPSQTSAWLSFHIWSCYSRCTPAVLQVNWWRGMQHPQVRPRRDALIPGNLDESVAL